MRELAALRMVWASAAWIAAVEMFLRVWVSTLNGLLHVTLGRQLIQSAGQYSRCVTATSRASRAAYKGVSDADHSRGLEVSQDRHIAQPQTN